MTRPDPDRDPYGDLRRIGEEFGHQVADVVRPHFLGESDGMLRISDVTHWDQDPIDVCLLAFFRAYGATMRKSVRVLLAELERVATNHSNANQALRDRSDMLKGQVEELEQELARLREEGPDEG